ncbi:MAG: glycosyltransferase family 4 protein [Pirellulaceae bacterium]
MSGVPWGGSEELWYRTARRLQNSNHEVFINFKWWPHKAAHLTDLEERGAQLWLRDRHLTFWEIQKQRFSAIRRGGANDSWIEEVRPDAVLVTLGYHPDRIPVADDCIKFDIPYAINVQSASSFFFIHSDVLESYREWYRNAKKVFFVSEENHHKLENNLAMKLDNAEIIDNPFNVDRNVKIDWPATDQVYRLACVGRVHFQSKGQDLIIDVMKQPKWRERNIEIWFYGKDQGNEAQLRDLIKLHGLEKQLKLGGFVNDVSEIWAKNHGLLLPSRYEGAALVVVEAMLCNRFAVSTDTGRNSELIEDDVSGFIAEAPTVGLLDKAMERAWANRENWKTIGQKAGESIRKNYSDDPIRDFADRLLALPKQS